MIPYCIILLSSLTSCYMQNKVSLINNLRYVDLEENLMDYELLPPRLQKNSHEDPKEFFFRNLKAYDGIFQDYVSKRKFENEENIPKPGGFKKIHSNSFEGSRQKRDVVKQEETKNSTRVENKEIEIEKHLGKPLEIGVLEAATSQESKITTGIPGIRTEKKLDDNLSINDFIRFRRGVDQDESQTAEDHSEKLEDAELIESIRPKRNNQKQQAEKIDQNFNNSENQAATREHRGAIKEQWIKQPYPVQNSDDVLYQDNYSSSSENFRAPRVHFVTQRRSEVVPPFQPYRFYEREPRTGDLARDVSSKDMSRESEYFKYRRMRYYEPIPPPSRYRYDPYYRFEDQRDRYNPIPDNYYSDQSPTASRNKNRRIIYYATLPDVSRTPPNVDLRHRYNDRDRYDDRFLYTQAIAGEPYHYKKVYPKSRYEESERGKTPYPQKVSTDVNVREIKKNPERRIYSEVDRSRYGFKVPLQRTDTTYPGRD